MFRRVAGRPDLPRMERAAQRRRMMSRCQRRIVSGVISSRSPWRRAFGITPSRAASRARSVQFSFGRRGCRRCNMASWWRRIKISAVFHVPSRRDSRSHAATRVIRRKTNRRHMIGDHHGRAAGRATLLVRAVDGILGTHSIPTGSRAHKGRRSDAAAIRVALYQHCSHQIRQRPGEVVLADQDSVVIDPDVVHGTAGSRPVWRGESRDAGDQFLPAAGIAAPGGVNYPVADAPVRGDLGDLKPHPPSLSPFSYTRQ